ncbi:MAG: methylmalonyl Co-A mutase-associated GTPase MeaB [Flavobacterium sp.]
MSGINEIKGISNTDGINPKVLHRVKNLRNKPIETTEIASKILQGNVVALSQGITLLESNQPKHAELASEIMQQTFAGTNTTSIRIGITGVPGVGKSTFIEAFGTYLTELGLRIAVLAIDPSSSISKGSILGDKTRMEQLARNPRAFIRPSASGSSLGGVAKKTREAVLLCEAAKFDVVLIETVGVGQSETTVHGMVDFFLLLKLAGAGDELQGIKRGIMEMADAIVINKADGTNVKNARIAKADFMRALHLFPPKTSGWTVPVLLSSATEKIGIAEIWEQIENFKTTTSQNGYWKQHRKEQQKQWMLEYLEEHLKNYFFNDSQVKENWNEIEQNVMLSKQSPYEAANQLLQLFYSNKKLP